MTYVIVYQAGIANVFKLTAGSLDIPAGRIVHRVYQGAFRDCEMFALGLRTMGAIIRVASANLAGDVSQHPWSHGLDDCPFRDAAHPVQS